MSNLIVTNPQEMQAVQRNQIPTATIAPGESSVPQTRSPDGRPQVRLPGPYREMSAFAADVGRIIKGKNTWFNRRNTAVEIREEKITDKITSTIFHPFNPTEARTALEDHIQTVRRSETEEGDVRLVPHTISREDANALLQSHRFITELPEIERILDVPTPVIHEGRIVWIDRGYNATFKTYCLETAPSITPKTIEEAKALINEMLDGFCWANEQSKVNAIARSLTPMCRGLIGWDAKTPLWIYEANRSRSGKDYLAACTPLIYEGRANEDAPIGKDPEETKKRIMAALTAGRRYMHFSNCKGKINDEGLEQAITSPVYQCRALGSNDGTADRKVANEAEFSISMNMGGAFTEDIELRARFISLSFYDEDANSRTFPKPDLHGWILDRRAELLGAVAGLITHWDSQGRPNGTTPFASYPKWARVVGGIMTCCGLGDPCASQTGQTLTKAGDNDDMHKLFELAYEKYGEQQIGRDLLYQIISDPNNQGVFEWMSPSDKSWQTAFGKRIRTFNNRILGGIQLEIDERTDRKRPKFRFKNLRPAEANKEKCPPCPHCPPLNTSQTTKVQISAGNPMVGWGENVPKVDNVDISTGTFPVGATVQSVQGDGREINSCTDIRSIAAIPTASIPARAMVPAASASVVHVPQPPSAEVINLPKPQIGNPMNN